MNPRLNKKVKKFLDAYFKGTSASSPEAHHAIMFILKGALTDANFHSTSKKVDKLFPKAKNAKYFGKREWEDSLESKGADIATMAKWDGHDILDAIGFFVSMYVGGPLGKKIEALKNESLNKESKLLENLSVLVEKNVPTNPSKWSYYKAQAKKKFDVYPSAYANAWAAKQYKAAGGGWRTTKENVEEDTVNETMKPSQVRSAISKVKKGLMRKWKQKGGYENFGQKELSQMRDKFDYNPYGSSDERQIAKMLDGFDNWAMNYDGNMRESTINEISAEGGLKRVIKGQTREVEGIKLSVPMAQAMLDWFNSSPYGRKYPRAKKARLHLSLGIMMGFGLDRYAKHKGAKDELKYIKTLAKAMRESTIKHLKSLNEGSMDWEKDFPWANEKELKVISKFINMNKRGIDGVLKMQKKDYKGFVRTVQKMVKLLPLMEIMEGKYNYKDDAMTAYMKGKISAQELDKIAKNDFKSSVATKQELQNFLKAGYMKELMANTYGLKVSDMEKKVKELMKYAS